MKLSRLILSLFIAATSVMAAMAHDEARTIAGTVGETSGESLPGAMVRACSGKRIVSYTATDSNGRFTLQLKAGTPDTLTVSVSCMGYATAEKRVIVSQRGSSPLRFSLEPSATELKEVVVKAPDIHQRGDTISFRLGSFAGKGDVTLEEGLKKIPGIEISNSGQINYLGRNISNFYVEGMQLAGSRYQQITRNLPGEYVTNVELIENHNAAAIDSGRQSDNVAMNIRISGKVMFRPVGTASAAAGYGANDRLLYDIAATGMMFSPKFQFMLTLKGSDINEVALTEAGRPVTTGGAKALGSLSGTPPPLSANRYRNPTDRLVTANSVVKLSANETLRGSAGYAYGHTSFSYSQVSSYFNAGNPDIVFSENNNPVMSDHRAFFDLELMHDGRTRYFHNTLSGIFEFLKQSNDVVASPSASPVDQRQRVRSWDLNDSFSWSLRKGERRYHLDGKVGYTISPLATLEVSPGDASTFSGTSELSSHTVNAQLETSLAWETSGCSTFTLEVGADWQNEMIGSDFDEYRNRLHGNRVTLDLVPRYEFRSRNQLFELTADAGIKALLLRARNHADKNTDANLTRLFASPDVVFRYKPSRRFTTHIHGGYTRSAGDIAELLTMPVMTSFRNVRVRSGKIGETQTWSGAAGAEYRNMISFWFANAQLSANHTKSNLIASQSVDGGQIVNGQLNSDNTSDYLSASAAVSKQIKSAGLKFNLGAIYIWNRSEIIQQSERMNYYGTTVQIKPSVVIAPVSLFELRLQGLWSKNFNRYAGSRSHNTTLNGIGHLSVFPAASVEIYADVDVMSKKSMATDYPTVTLFDAGVKWRVGKIRLTLSAENLLDKRRYYYTVYSGLDTYTYDYALRGRMFTAGVSITM